MGNSTRKPARRRRLPARGSVKKAVNTPAQCFTEPVIQKDILSLDIWILIMEELSKLTDDLRSYRLISRRLDGVIIPFVFGTSRVTKTILPIVDRRRTVSLRTAELVKGHTRRLVFQNIKLNWDIVAEFIRECRCVQDIEWHYDPNVSFPPAIRQVLEHDKPHIRLHIIAFLDVRDTFMSPDFDALPRDNLVSFSSKSNYRSFEHGMLQKLLVEAKGLQRMDIPTIGVVIDPSHPMPIQQDFTVEGGMLPPVIHLAVGGAWRYTKASVPKIWNFSQLDSLIIRKGCGSSFLQTVSPEAVSRIRVLHIEDLIIGHELGHHFHVVHCDRLEHFLGGIKGLLEITLTCITPMKALSLLSKHCKTLEVLRLKDSNYNRPTLDINHLKSLEASFPNLSELQVDLDFPLFRVGQKLDRLSEAELKLYIKSENLFAIASNPNLHILHIRPQICFSIERDKPRKFFCDAVIKALTSQKKGRPFTNVTFQWRQHNQVLDMRYSWNIYGENEMYETSRVWKYVG